MNYKIFLIFLVTCCSCNYSKEVIQVDGAMEGTIPKGAFVTYIEKNKIELGDVVLFNFRGDGVSSMPKRILRVVGMPGDTLEIRNGNIYINQEILSNPRYTKFTYYIRAKGEVRNSILANRYYRQISQLEYLVGLSDDELPEVRSSLEIDSISLFVTDSAYEEKHIIKDRSFKYFNSHFLGPVIIPRKGDLFSRYTSSISPAYSSIINQGGIVSSNCYFLMGDNRFFCYDSKYLGVIPESDIIGIIDSVSMNRTR